MTPVLRSSQRQRGFKVWATPQVAYYQAERGGEGKENGRLYYQTPLDFPAAKENTTFLDFEGHECDRDRIKRRPRRKGERE
jgi:hypothetical protein